MVLFVCVVFRNIVVKVKFFTSFDLLSDREPSWCMLWGFFLWYNKHMSFSEEEINDFFLDEKDVEPPKECLLTEQELQSLTNKIKNFFNKETQWEH